MTDGPIGPCGTCGSPGALEWGPDTYCWAHLPTTRATWPIGPRFRDGVTDRGKRIPNPIPPPVTSTTAGG